VRLTFLGVRGSTPSPGADFVRYGGHTSCVIVAHDADQPPTLVLDAGTGIRSLTAVLDGEAFQGTILLSHLHWDHVQGVPFFGAGDRDDSRIEIFLPGQDGKSGRELMAQFLSPPAFPITPDGLRGRWAFHAIDPGHFATQGFEITASEIGHKGGRTFGYRIDAGGSVAFLPDHAPTLGVTDETISAFRGVDVLIHDGQFLDGERAVADDYGHATVSDALDFAERIEAGTLVLFHHGPHRHDDALDHIMDDHSAHIPVLVAYEGMSLDVPGLA
jgi:phosphoribosyl 1,2-cyclic phosphodiesterase